MTTPLRHTDIDDAIPASGTQLADRGKTNALLKRIAFHAAAAPAAVERSVQQRLGDVVSIKDFGARGELARASDISTTAASTTVTAASPRWTDADVGKWIFIEGAGDFRDSTLYRSTITAVGSATSVTVADAAVLTVSNAYAEWGSDDTTPLRDAIAWCRDNGKELFLPSGVYTVDPAVMNTAIPINDNGRLIIRGAGPTTILRRIGASPTQRSRMLRLSSTSGGFRLVQLSDLEIDANDIQNPWPDGETFQWYSQASSFHVEATATSVIDVVITRNLTLRNGMGDHLRVAPSDDDLQVKVNCWLIENIVERDRKNGRSAAILHPSVAQVLASNMISDHRALQYEPNKTPADREVFHHYDNIVMHRLKMTAGRQFVNAVLNQVRVTGEVQSISVKCARFINCDIVQSSTIVGEGYIELIGCTIRALIDVSWKGPWVDGDYAARDAVSHGDIAWVAVAPVSAGQVPGDADSGSPWEEISPSNTTASGLAFNLVTGIPFEIKFIRCKFIIEAPAIVGNVAGFATREGTVATDTDPTLRRFMFEECEFDPRFQYSIQAYRSGDFITRRCRFRGWERGILVSAGSTTRQSWTSIDDDFSGAAVPFRARNTAGLVRLDLRHSGMPFAQAAWESGGWSDDAGHVSTRLLWIDEADLVDGAPVGGGVAGDRARLRKPVAGETVEWICTASHPSAATWKALSSVAA